MLQPKNFEQAMMKQIQKENMQQKVIQQQQIKLRKGFMETPVKMYSLERFVPPLNLD